VRFAARKGFKSFPVQTDEHFLTVCRYVERNPLRAGLVKRAEARPWSSLWRRRCGVAQERKTSGKRGGGKTGRVRLLTQTGELLGDWPVDRPARWTARVNAAETTEELEQLRLSVARGKPLTRRTDVRVKGNPTWTQRTIARLGPESSTRPRGRPRTQTHDQA
jgi:putative transposase